ncbi:ROK family protein [Sandaracinus amylolyticus]|uniref:ROK family protein n=1 Tax=Sandaracinus amylolyticus TaxID=927083 RepID=UPI001F45ED0F|nr:ROK family protein [Sandaracinus amylolyticus]UJR81682.1 N-acetylglucosamine kinase [Sandaracinus amylolyticus]
MRIGVDLGGTKIEAIALAEDGNITARRRIATPARDGYDAIIAAIAELVRTVEREADCEGASVGVGTPGALSPATGLLRNANTVCLNERPLDRDLSRALGRPVRIANDANCFALSEASDGAAAGAEIVFGVILGTGVGGGVVVRGSVLNGRHGIAGEWGHTPLPWPRDDERPGRACYCGRHGCVETWCSGPALAEDHRARTGETLDGPTIAARADAGDAACEATLARYVDRLARSLAIVIDVIDPDVIVLGGGVGSIARLYRDVPAQLSSWVFSDVVTTRIVPPEHGDSSGVRGAAWLWPIGGAR